MAYYPGRAMNTITLLVPDFLLILIGYTPKQLQYGTGGPKEIENLYTRAMLEEAFGDFDDVSSREHDSEISEGAGHAGVSALIDLIGWKPR